ncbi:MAG: Gfo/Idh/MocA family protein [Puniceicoccales bacterium]
MKSLLPHEAPIRLGIAGLGMGSAHATSICTSSEIEIIAVADPDKERHALLIEKVDELRKEEHLPPIGSTVEYYDDYRRMIDESNLDGIVIALATHLHAEASLYALEKGIAVLCEKPPTTHTESMVPVAQLARQKGLVYLFGRQQRFSPRNQKIRTLIAEGELGKVYMAQSSWYRTGWIPFRKGYGMNKKTGGGALLDLGIHQLDDGWFAMGCPQPVSVTCEMQCNFPHLTDGETLEVPYDADDTTLALIRFEDGSVLSFLVTFALNSAGPALQPIEKEGRAHWLELSLYGTKAGIEAHRNLITYRKGNSLDVEVRELLTEKIKSHLDLLKAQLLHFADCIRGRATPLNNAEQAIMLMQMLDACRESAETGRSVQIENVENLIQ